MQRTVGAVFNYFQENIVAEIWVFNHIFSLPRQAFRKLLISRDAFTKMEGSNMIAKV